MSLKIKVHRCSGIAHYGWYDERGFSSPTTRTLGAVISDKLRFDIAWSYYALSQVISRDTMNSLTLKIAITLGVSCSSKADMAHAPKAGG